MSLLLKKNQQATSLLRDYLNILWLRPESALFLAISAYAIQNAPYQPIVKPSLDMGAGNGLFSFLAMGGALTLDYDYYLEAGNLDKFWEHGDIYDHFRGAGKNSFISRAPETTYSHAYDHKDNLKKQASFLNFYDDYRVGNANLSWPYKSASLKSIFSNIFYWLNDPEFLLREMARVLDAGGRGFLALQAPQFPQMCPSYHREKYPEMSKTLELLNRGRADCSLWRLSLSDLEKLGKKNGLKLVHHRYYLSEIILRIWDIGLRPFSPLLISMANSLSAENRLRHKKEWIEICHDLLQPIFESEKNKTSEGGYLYVIFEKI